MKFLFFRKKRIKKYTFGVDIYLLKNYEPEVVLESDDEILHDQQKDIKHSYGDCDVEIWGLSDEDRIEEDTVVEENIKQEEPLPDLSGIRFHLRSYEVDDDHSKDKYNSDRIAMLMKSVTINSPLTDFHTKMDRMIDRTFVDKLIYFINKKGMRDSQVYKAAYVDKRLFSKIMSNREYKPSKDTAIALAFALKLTLSEAEDLLSRAGYTLSHSNKRDVIIEYFFREGIYNIMDINEVLFHLDQKIIGRI